MKKAILLIFFLLIFLTHLVNVKACEDVNIIESLDSWKTNITNVNLSITTDSNMDVYSGENTSLYLNDQWVSCTSHLENLSTGVYILRANNSCSNNRTLYLTISNVTGVTNATKNESQTIANQNATALLTQENLSKAWSSLSASAKIVLGILVVVIIIVAVVSYKKSHLKFKR